jgi:excisionase family DNA binding protein
MSDADGAPSRAILSTRQAAERLGVSRFRVIQFIREGRLEATKLGREYMIEEDALGRLVRYPQGAAGWARNRDK